MKKVIAVLLSVLLAFSCMALTASALQFDEDPVYVGDKDNANQYVYQYKVLGTCGCHFVGEHTGACSCCVLCPNFDTSKLSDCARSTAPIGIGDSMFDGYLCCTDCVGMKGCNCGCPCCGLVDEDIENENGNSGGLITDEQKDSFVDGFQSILKTISDAFDRFFDAIFAFLKLDQVLGRN